MKCIFFLYLHVILSIVCLDSYPPQLQYSAYRCAHVQCNQCLNLPSSQYQFQYFTCMYCLLVEAKPQLIEASLNSDDKIPLTTCDPQFCYVSVE